MVTECVWRARSDGLYECPDCGRVQPNPELRRNCQPYRPNRQPGVISPERPPRKPRPPARPIPVHGPGSELTELIHSLGLMESSTCSCASRAAQMNAWGIDGCKANRETIVGWVQEEYDKATPEQIATAKRRALETGLWKKLLRDPVAGLVDEAIRRAAAEKKT